jgi:hypothetical protein
MLLIALLLAAAPEAPVALSELSQVKDLCAALGGARVAPDADPAEQVAAQKAADSRRDEAAARWYRVEIPSKGFVFGRYRELERQLELDGDRPLRAIDGALSLDLDGIDDVAFNARPEQVSAWSKEKKAGGLRLVVVFKPNAERCAGSNAAEAWRLAGKVKSWELAGQQGAVATADEEGRPVGGGPRSLRIDKVSLESDEEPAQDDGRGRLAAVRGALEKCAGGAPRSGTMVVSFSVQSGHARDAQVIMDSLRDESVASCVTRAVNGAAVSGSGRGTASLSLD